MKNTWSEKTSIYQDEVCSNFANGYVGKVPWPITRKRNEWKLLHYAPNIIAWHCGIKEMLMITRYSERRAQTTTQRGGERREGKLSKSTTDFRSWAYLWQSVALYFSTAMLLLRTNSCKFYRLHNYSMWMIYVTRMMDNICLIWHLNDIYFYSHSFLAMENDWLRRFQGTHWRIFLKLLGMLWGCSFYYRT